MSTLNVSTIIPDAGTNTDLSLDGKGTGKVAVVDDASVGGDLSFPDNSKAIWGTGSDMSVHWDGTDGHLTVGGTLNIDGSGETMATFADDGPVTLYWDNAARIATGQYYTTFTGSFNFTMNNTASTSIIKGVATSGGENTIVFRDGDSNDCGIIAINATNNTASYATSSDYRLKENVDYTWDATTRLKQLKPAQFSWKSDPDSIMQDGFLAHEAAEVVPQAVVGEKDGEIYQNIDHSKIVPLLVKTIQELEARITVLENN